MIFTQEGVGTQELMVHTDESITNTRLLYEELTALRLYLAKVSKLYSTAYLKNQQNGDKNIRDIYFEQFCVKTLACWKQLILAFLGF